MLLGFILKKMIRAPGCTGRGARGAPAGVPGVHRPGCPGRLAAASVGWRTACVRACTLGCKKRCPKASARMKVWLSLRHIRHAANRMAEASQRHCSGAAADLCSAWPVLGALSAKVRSRCAGVDDAPTTQLTARLRRAPRNCTRCRSTSPGGGTLAPAGPQ